MIFLNIPKDINIKIGENWIKIKGPLGEIVKKKSRNIKIFFDKESSKLYIFNDKKNNINFYLLLINKLIWGLYKGFTCKLVLIGVGYKVSIESNKLVFRLGYSHDVIYTIPEDIKINLVPKQKNITLLIFGNNHQKVKQVASEIRKLREPYSYKGKGIRFFDEVIIQKQGKKN